MKIHELKCWEAVFQPLIDGTKTFEFRKNDRNFETGDILREREWNPDTEKYTGREVSVKVGFIVHGGAFGIPSGYVIMSVSPESPPAPTDLLLTLPEMREAFRKYCPAWHETQADVEQWIAVAKAQLSKLQQARTTEQAREKIANGELNHEIEQILYSEVYVDEDEGLTLGKSAQRISELFADSLLPFPDEQGIRER